MQADALAGLDKAAVARRFNRSATTYDACCRVQRRMADRLLERLGELPAPDRILELGCGTGCLTELLAKRFPSSQILALDLAERMVDIARERVPEEGVEFRVADAEKAKYSPCSYDLVISNATIQWFEAPSQSLPPLTRALRPGGLMLHATFGPATFWELKSALEGEAPAGPGLPLRTGEEWSALLGESGLSGIRSDRRLEVERYSTAAGLLRELQATGVTYRPNAAELQRHPRALAHSLARYETRFNSPEGVPATYELLEVWGVAAA